MQGLLGTGQAQVAPITLSYAGHSEESLDPRVSIAEQLGNLWVVKDLGEVLIGIGSTLQDEVSPWL